MLAPFDISCGHIGSPSWHLLSWDKALQSLFRAQWFPKLHVWLRGHGGFASQKVASSRFGTDTVYNIIYIYMCRYLYLYTIIYTYMSFRNIYNNKSIYLNKLQIEKHLYIYIFIFVTHACTMTYVSCVQFESKCGSCNNLCSLATVGKRPDAQPVVTVWTPVFAQRNGLLMFAAFTEIIWNGK